MGRFRWVMPGLGGVLVLLMAAGFSTPDDNFVQQVATQLEQFYVSHYPEKSYVHLDKPFYAAGETLWFEAYVVDASHHLPDTLSRVLYVDLVSPQNRVVAQRVLRVRQGTANGDFTLADTLAQGTYTVRAYTSWMRNAGPDFFFTRRVPVWHTDPTAAPAVATSRRRKPTLDATTAPLPGRQPDVQFFPEGGNLVAGLDNKVAFKVTDAYGRGVEVTGIIKDAQGADVLAFRSLHLGMGNFLLNPAAGQHYQARVKLPDGTVVVCPLPVAQATGFTLNAVELGSVINVIVRRRTADPAAPPESIVLLAHVRGMLSYAGKGQMDNTTFTARIPKSKFPTGTAHFTLFDGQGVARCERLVFVHNQPTLQVRITPEKATYGPHEIVNLNLEVRDADGQPVAARLSLAVNSNQVVAAPDPNANNILSALLLTSDLKGYVENPAYYFQNNADATQALDNLLLTQGWRRFVWKELLANSFAPSPFPLERSLSLSGQVLNSGTRPIAGSPVTLLVSRPARGLASATTDADGRFLFSGFAEQDTTQAMVQAKGIKGGRNPALRLIGQAAAVVKQPLPPLVSPEPEVAAYLRTSKKQQTAERRYRLDTTRTIMLNNVTIKGHKPAETDARRLYTNADAVVKLGDNPAASSYVNVLQALQGRVAGVNVTGSGLNMRAQIRGQGSPQYLLDGVPVEDDIVNTISPSDVESIEVLKGASAAIYGGRGAGGVIAIYTKRGNPSYDYSKDPVPPSLAYVKRPGFYRTQEFYSPQYNGATLVSKRPDNRATTLYWNPRIVTDASGKARVSFYSSAEGGAFRVAGEGLSTTGTPGVGSSTFTVTP